MNRLISICIVWVMALFAVPVAFSKNIVLPEGDPSFDIQFYHITISPKIHEPYINGSVLIRFKSQKESLSAIRLQLEKHLVIDSITGRENKYSIEDDDYFKVVFSRPLGMNESCEIRIFYQGVPQLANGIKGLRYELHGKNVPVIASLSTPFLAHYWYPCKDGPEDKADSVYVDIHIPNQQYENYPLIGVSNGLLVKIDSTVDQKIFHWRHRYPIVPYYVMIAISNYRLIRHNYKDPFGNQFPLEYFTFPENYDSSLKGTKDLPKVLDEFSRLYGPYPFKKEKYGMTELGFYSGIENQTNVIVNNLGPADFETQVHELAHMWFADMITCKNWHHAWLNEGFATYSEVLWAEKMGGLSGYQIKMQDQKILDGTEVFIKDISDPFGIFVSPVYFKASWVLHMLRKIMGDEPFFAAVKDYASDPRFQYGHADTDDFRLVCEKYYGASLQKIFREWIYSEGYPVYALVFKNDLPQKVRLIQMQKRLYDWPIFNNPFEITFKRNKSLSSGLILDSTDWEDIEIDLTGNPGLQPPFPDPYENILCAKVLVTDFAKWEKDGFPFFENSCYAETGEMMFKYTGEKAINCELEIFSSGGLSIPLAHKGKISSDNGIISWDGFTDPATVLLGFEGGMLVVKMKEYELRFPFTWVRALK